jgi:hypothetical protein
MTSKKPLILLLLGLIALLMTIGLGYGLWSESLVIEGSVITGEVDASWLWYLSSCDEFHPWPPGPGLTPGEYLGKDVGWWEMEIDPVDDRIMHLTIYNGYPSYALNCDLKFAVEGTVPIIVRGNTIVQRTDNLTNCQVSGINSTLFTCDELTVQFVDNVGAQLHPGDWAASNLLLHIEQPAEEGATYEFDLLLCMAQWNEAASLEECLAASP